MVDALNDKNGAAVDWWFIYKLPRGLKAPAKPARATSGLEYLYYQPDDPVGFKMSRRRLDDPGSALQRTVTSALTAAERSDSELGWILYNRGPFQPDRPNGHGRIRSAQSLSKGMLLFDRVANRGLWLVHTAPGYLWGPKSDFPDEERDRGHTFPIFCG